MLPTIPTECSFNIFHITSRNRPMQRSQDAVNTTKKRKKSWYHCFPSHAELKLRNGTKIPMDSLRAGDDIQTRDNTTSRLYLFTHAEPSGRHEFIQLETRHGNLTASLSHLVVANYKYIPASSVRPGDMLDTDIGLQSLVSRVSFVTARGLYHPQTLDGRIAVDGFVATTYTSKVLITIATSLLSPLRALFKMTGIDATHGTFERDNFLRTFLVNAISSS